MSDTTETPSGDDVPRPGPIARLRRSRAARWSFDIGLALLLFWGISAWQSRNMAEGPAPGFALRDMGGQAHTLADYRGKRLLVVFWAPWCGVCKTESDNVSRIHGWAEDSDAVDVISIAVGYKDVASVDAYIEAQSVTYPVLLGSTELSRAYGINAFPSHVVIDETGSILHAGQGYTTTFGYARQLWW